MPNPTCPATQEAAIVQNLVLDDATERSTSLDEGLDLEEIQHDLVAMNKLKALGVQFAVLDSGVSVLYDIDRGLTYTCRFDCSQCVGKIVVSSIEDRIDTTLPDECMGSFF